AFTVCIRTENQNQVSFCPFTLREVSVLTELTLGHLRYLLTDVPPQSNSPPDMTADPNYVKQPMDVDVLDSSGNVQGKLRANHKTQLYLWESFVNNAPKDVIAQMMEDLSPTSNDLMNPLLQNLRKKGAERWDDRSALKCKDDSQVRADDSSINKIVRPKTDDELVVSLEGFLERIIFLQKETPSGVVLSSSHVRYIY
ncbi:Hypothetical predicted protein, partial [Mytilus galloprovincialis]